MGKRLPGSGGAQVSSLSAKGHLKRGIKLQKTPIYGAEHGQGEAGAQGTGGQKNTTPTTRNQQGNGPPVKAGRGGSGRSNDGGKQREEGNLGQDNPWG